MLEPAGKARSTEERHPDVVGAPAGEPEDAAPGGVADLPTEPVAPWTETARGFADPRWNAGAVHKQLLRFSAYGLRDENAPVVSADARPALLHAYRDLTHFRHEFPLCLPDTGGEAAAVPLTRIIDGLLDVMALEGDERERCRRHLYQLEAALGAIVESSAGQRLSALWDRAAERVLARHKLSAEKQRELADDLDRARAALAVDGELLGCADGAASRLLSASLAAHWRRHAERWREEIDGLAIRLEQVIRADDSHDPAARSPDRLRESVADPTGDEVDVDRMADILGRAHLGEPLPAARRSRLERSLSTLREMLPLLEADACAPGAGSELPFDLGPIDNDCHRAGAECERRLQRMVELIRATRIAELEIANGYREDVHDDYFASFDASHLTAEELSVCPPVILHLDQATLAAGAEQALLRLLASGHPVKVLLELDTLYREDPVQSVVLPDWAARLAGAALAMNDVFVLQCPVSRGSLLEDGFRAGLAYSGAALFSVYVGGPSDWVRFLDASAAADSRAFPLFRFNPGLGQTQAERMQLTGNSDPAGAWPIETFRYRAAEGEEAGTGLAFTLADFLFADPRLGHHYWAVPPALWHPEMVPLQTYLEADEESRATQIPCLVAVTDEEEIVRVVVTRAVALATSRCAGYWRALQEAGGVNNSHALALLEREKARLAEEKASEVEVIERRHEERLDANIGELTREIVGRIASQLIQGGAAPHAAPMPPVQPPAAPAATEAQAEPAESPQAAAAAEEDEEEAFSLDEPYIDTPLCTSCDDCTRMSPQIFAYDENKQAYIKDAAAGTYQELVLAAEKCPVKIIHPGKPKNPDEPGLEEWMQRAQPYL